MAKALVTSLSTRSTRFDPVTIHVTFMVDKVAVGQVFLPVPQRSPVSINPPTLHTHLHLYAALIISTNG